MMTLIRGLSYLISNGRPISFQNVDSVIFPSFFGWLFFIAFGVISVIWIQFPAFGRNINLNHSSGLQAWLKRAVLVGIPYIISSFAAGLAGILLLSRIRAGMPSLGIGYEFDVIFAVVLGGTFFGAYYGNAIGAIFAAFIISIFQNILNLIGVSAYFQMFFLGILFLIILCLNYGYYAIVGLLYRQKYGNKSEVIESST
jgi:ribose/xylose/arabinose/galactoside ABC-type transport system permease subunit